jgi:DUF1009 family protein
MKIKSYDFSLEELQEFTNNVKESLINKLILDGEIFDKPEIKKYVILLKTKNSFGKILEKIIPTDDGSITILTTKIK